MNDTKIFKTWADNRGRNWQVKVFYWLRRPIGGLIRSLEILTLGTTVQNLIRSHNDVNEIKHLLPGLTILDDSNDYIVKNARITTANGLLLLESGHVIARHIDSHSYLSGNMIDELRFLLKSKRQRIPGGPALVVPQQTFFYHFLIDTLPYVIRASRSYPNLRIYLHQANPAFVFSYLKLHKINYEVTTKSVLDLEQALVLNYIGLDLAQIKELLSIDVSSSIKTHAKIAFLRNRGARYNQDLEADIHKTLINKGFQIFDPDTLTQVDQIKLFSNANEIIAIHGGVLANIIYCREGTTVTEIFSHPYRTLFFKAISASLDLQYSSMEIQDYLTSSSET